MSYSRWLHSVWYTYWEAGSGDTIDEQTLAIHGIEKTVKFCYNELKEDKNGCLASILNSGDYTDREMEELSGYMDNFLEDVEKEFGENNEGPSTKV